MKKIFVLLVALTLVFSFALSAFAVEGEEVTTPTTENATEGEIAPPTPTEKTEEDVTITNYIKNLTDVLGNSSIWTMIATVAAALIAVYAFLRRKFGIVIDVLKGKADTAALNAKFEEKSAELKREFMKTYDATLARLDAAESNEKAMYAALAIFMTHAKIAPAVKAEIIDRITGIKEMSGTLTEIVAEAEKAITEALEADKKNAPETPVLDMLIPSEEGKSEYMTL